MAAKGTSSVKVQRNIQGFANVLTSAACEWFLIFLLLIDGVLSYLLTKFASYCELQAPCVLCSRLDHVLGNEKPEYYWSLLCSNHRSEISSLVSCHIHSKLADGHWMCEDCLLSFTKQIKPKPESHRFLVSKLGMILGGSLLNGDIISGSMGSRMCNCCGKPWKLRQNGQRLIQLKLSGTRIMKPNIPLPRLPSRSRLNRRESLKKIRDRISGSATSRRIGKGSHDPLSHVGYSELKINSDSESEFPFSDDEDVGSLICPNVERKEDQVVQCASVISPTNMFNDPDPAKSKNSFSNSRPSLLEPCVQPDVSKPHGLKFLASDVFVDYGLGEIDWQQVNQNSDPYTVHELISLDEVLPSSNVVEVSYGESRKSKNESSYSPNSIPAGESECITIDATLPFHGASPEKPMDVTQVSDVEHASINKHEEDSKNISTLSGESIETVHVVNDSALTNPSQDHSANVREFVVTGEERETSDFVAGQLTMEEGHRLNEGLKLLPLHNSSPQRINTSSTITIKHGRGDEKQLNNVSSSNEIQVLQKSVSVDSGLESLDGGNFSEIEGEPIVDRSKRQVEYYSKCMKELYKELEEERNASAIAANEAMAMITRLQEEKAALHMEALQYLRMMEEQAEYDVEALEKANDLLAEKEKEIQDLQGELEFYRSNFTDESMVENIPVESCSLKGENVTVQSVSVPCISNSINVSSYLKVTETSSGNDEADVAESSFLQCEDEKLYIFQCLKSLEKKLDQISQKGTSLNMTKFGHCEKLADDNHSRQEFCKGEGIVLNGQIEDDNLHMQKDFHISNGSPTAENGSVASDSDDRVITKENGHVIYGGQKNSIQQKEFDLVVLDNEISDLNDRLEALEADHDFLEHAVNSLLRGNDGLQFVREIARHLQELRNFGIRLR
ncbi:myosin-binding protein 1-like [Quillaja saponaria]|nr:myosin-binding protein 1-like [Quillaja saponaria]